jgi:hypothetical protein
VRKRARRKRRKRRVEKSKNSVLNAVMDSLTHCKEIC